MMQTFTYCTIDKDLKVCLLGPDYSDSTNSWICTLSTEPAVRLLYSMCGPHTIPLFLLYSHQLHTMTTSSEELTSPIHLESSDNTIIPAIINEMCKVSNSANPLIMPVRKVTANWTSHILEKDVSKWEEWSYSMTSELLMAQLWEYIFNQAPSLQSMYKFWAYWA